MRRLAAQAHGRRRNTAARRDRSSTQLARPASAPVPDQRRIYTDMADLLAQDLANVEAGIYPRAGGS